MSLTKGRVTLTTKGSGRLQHKRTERELPISSGASCLFILFSHIGRQKKSVLLELSIYETIFSSAINEFLSTH